MWHSGNHHRGSRVKVVISKLLHNGLLNNNDALEKLGNVDYDSTMVFVDVNVFCLITIVEHMLDIDALRDLKARLNSISSVIIS